MLVRRLGNLPHPRSNCAHTQAWPLRCVTGSGAWRAHAQRNHLEEPCLTTGKTAKHPVKRPGAKPNMRDHRRRIPPMQQQRGPAALDGTAQQGPTLKRRPAPCAALGHCGPLPSSCGVRLRRCRQHRARGRRPLRRTPQTPRSSACGSWVRVGATAAVGRQCRGRCGAGMSVAPARARRRAARNTAAASGPLPLVRLSWHRTPPQSRALHALLLEVLGILALRLGGKGGVQTRVHI